MGLNHLFDAELRYRAGMEPVATDGDGRLIGSGDGTIRGPALEGSLRWTLFEHPGELVCAMNPALVITTLDAAEIRVEARGFASRATADDQRWRVAATLLFRTDADRYRWLDATLGVWEGEFDGEAHRARYTAYAVDPGGGAP